MENMKQQMGKEIEQKNVSWKKLENFYLINFFSSFIWQKKNYLNI
jgi:hypothetical protein